MATLNYSLVLAPGSPQCTFNATENRFEQTWVYVLTKTGDTTGAALSHLEIALCPNHNVLEVSKNGTTVPVAQASTLNIVIGAPNGNCLTNPPVVRMIKWDSLSEAADLPFTNGQGQIFGTFDFVLEGCYVEGLVDAAIKGGSEQSGGGCDFRSILGPTCELIPPPNRGIKLSQFEE